MTYTMISGQQNLNLKTHRHPFTFKREQFNNSHLGKDNQTRDKNKHKPAYNVK